MKVKLVATFLQLDGIRTHTLHPFSIHNALDSDFSMLLLSNCFNLSCRDGTVIESPHDCDYSCTPELVSRFEIKACIFAICMLRWFHKNISFHRRHKELVGNFMFSICQSNECLLAWPWLGKSSFPICRCRLSYHSSRLSLSSSVFFLSFFILICRFSKLYMYYQLLDESI